MRLPFFVLREKRGIDSPPEAHITIHCAPFPWDTHGTLALNFVKQAPIVTIKGVRLIAAILIADN